MSQNHYIEPFKIDIDYGILKEEYLEIYNDGFKLFLKGNFGTIKYGDHNFKVSEIHLHHPSEHTVNMCIVINKFNISLEKMN